MSKPDIQDRLPTRMTAQLDFLLAADALKLVERNNVLHSGARLENTAEHSWHLTLLALTFAEHAPPEVDMSRVIQLLVVHDLVEIHAGDHWELSADAAEVAKKEAEAADALFDLLPHPQATEMRGLWEEFEARNSPDAKFAKAIDALQPMLLVWGPGGTGKTHTPLNARQLRDLKRPSLAHYPALWELAQNILDVAVENGLLPEV
jgi:putative hydrolase of HD superfamily